MLNNITPQDEQNYQNLLTTINTEALKNLSPVEFCRLSGQDKAIKNNTSTRQKKRFLIKLKGVLEVLDKIGFEVVLKPKKNGLDGL